MAPEEERKPRLKATAAAIKFVVGLREEASRGPSTGPLEMDVALETQAASRALEILHEQDPSLRSLLEHVEEGARLPRASQQLPAGWRDGSSRRSLPAVWGAENQSGFLQPVGRKQGIATAQEGGQSAPLGGSYGERGFGMMSHARCYPA